MSKQSHDIGWKKANREGAPTRGRAAAERRKAAKAARAAVLLARMETATLSAEWDEEFHVRERARAAGVLVAEEPQPAPEPGPQSVTPTRACRHCGEPFPVQGEGRWRYCSNACRAADRPSAPPAQGSMRDRPHRTLLGSK